MNATIDRLMKRITRTADGCWVWNGSRDGGYGKVKVDGCMWRVHRLTYTLLVGPIPEGLTIDHLCRNKLCANPAHLEPVTNLENMRRSLPYRTPHANTYWATKTHCPRNHPYDAENTGVTKKGGRICRRCARERMRARRAARQMPRAA